MGELPIMEIYLDLLFILNFTMDCFIFWMVSKITCQKVSKVRLVIGSLVAAMLYCLVVMIPFLRTVNIIMYLILLPLLPIKIIFNPINMKEWVQTFVVSNITALIIGGMSYGLFYWIKEQDIISNIYKKTYDKFSVWVLLFSILGSYLVIQLFRYYMQKRNTGIERVYLLKVVYDGKQINIEALLDTGNKVYDPISKHPVIIVEYEALAKLLPQGVRDIYDSDEEDVTRIVEAASQYEFGTKIRLIPYQSLGNPNGILLGFKADEVYVEGNGMEEKQIEHVIIAVYKHKLSIEDTYYALLHGDLIS